MEYKERKIGFVKNVNLLDETYQVEDLLDFSASISDFKKYLSGIQNHSIVGFIGDFGSGKSTMLYQIQEEKKEKGDTSKWFVFDAWAFPNRKDLWEGFILDFAKHTDKKVFEKTRKLIDGEKYTDVKMLVKILSKGFNLFLPGAGIVENFNALFKSSPARRVFEFREMFLQLIEESVQGDLFVVLEDVDRSGFEGAVFLETLKQFIKNDLERYTKHKITFIVPMGTKNYQGEYSESYKKSLDYAFQFKPEMTFKKFIEEVFIEEMFLKNNEFWQGHLDQLFRFFMKGKTMRDLKKVLRQANQSFLSQKVIENFHPDPRVTILLEIFYENGESFTRGKVEGDARDYTMIHSEKNFYAFYCLAIAMNQDLEEMMKRGSYRMPKICFISNHNIFVPQVTRNFATEGNYLEISDCYWRSYFRL